MIKIIAKATVKKEKRLFFLESALKLAEESRKEEGNISYGLFEDTENFEILTFMEEWKSVDAVKIHEESDHFKENISRLMELAQSIDINLYNQVL